MELKKNFELRVLFSTLEQNMSMGNTESVAKWGQIWKLDSWILPLLLQIIYISKYKYTPEN